MNNFFKLISISNKNKNLKLFTFFLFLLLLPFLEALGVGLIIPLISNIQQGVYENNIINEFNLVFDNFLKFFFDNEPSKKDKIYFSLTLFSLSIVIKVFVFFFFNFFKAKLIYELQTFLSGELCNKTFSRSYLYFASRNSSSLVRDLQNEINIVAHYIESFFVLITELIIAFSILTFLFIYDWYITFLILVTYSVSLSLYFLLGKKKIKKWSKKRVIFDGFRLRTIDELLNSIKEIKIFQKESFFINRFLYFTGKAYKINKYLSIYSSNIRYWFELSSLILILLIINYYLNNIEIIDEILLTLGVMFYIVARISPSIIKIFNSFNQIKINYFSINNILNYFKEEKKEFENLKFGQIKFDEINNIVLENLSYQYPNSKKNTLNNINFVFKKGKISGIFGKSGSGKSTLINLLTGIINTDDNCIKLNNDYIFNSVDIKNFRKKIGYVSQQTFILDEDIKKNIAFGVDEQDIDILKVEECIKKAELKDKDGNLLNLEIKTGQKGSLLSVGQQQRVGIARALYFKPDILIMDEPTSSLDKDTGLRIINTFTKLKHSVITIIVTHDKSLINNFDNILELK